MRKDVKSYSIFRSRFFGYLVRRDLQSGGYEWMGRYLNECSAGEFDWRFAWFPMKWLARRAIACDGENLGESSIIESIPDAS